MNLQQFKNIVNSQVKINSHKDVVKNYLKVTKKCGFFNAVGFDQRESDIKPIREYGEVRLFENISINGEIEEVYGDYIKVKPLDNTAVWYGTFNNYLIKNIGDSCQTVYLLS